MPHASAAVSCWYDAVSVVVLSATAAPVVASYCIDNTPPQCSLRYLERWIRHHRDIDLHLWMPMMYMLMYGYNRPMMVIMMT